MSSRPDRTGYSRSSQGENCKRLQKLSAVDKLHRIQEVVRHVEPPLEPFKFTVMVHVWDASTSWGKRWGFLSLNDLAERCVMSKRKVMTTLIELVELDLLTRRVTHDKNGYRVNYEVIEAMAMGRKGADMLARKGSGSASVLGHDVHSTRAPGALQYLPLSKATTSQIADRSVGDTGAVDSKEDSQAQDSTQAALDDYARRHWHKAGAKHYRVTWESAWHRAGYSKFAGVGCPAWSRKAEGQASALRKKFPGTTYEFHEFLNWVVGDWQRAMDGWGGLGKPPLPVIAYLLAARDKFFGLWAAKKVDGFANDRTKDIVERMQAEGMPEAEALGRIYGERPDQNVRTMPLTPFRKKKWIY